MQMQPYCIFDFIDWCVNTYFIHKVWSTSSCEFVRTLNGHKRGIACLQYHDRYNVYVSECVEGYLIFTALSEDILLPELCLKEFFAAGNYGTLHFE